MFCSISDMYEKGPKTTYSSIVKQNQKNCRTSQRPPIIWPQSNFLSFSGPEYNMAAIHLPASRSSVWLRVLRQPPRNGHRPGGRRRKEVQRHRTGEQLIQFTKGWSSGLGTRLKTDMNRSS